MTSLSDLRALLAAAQAGPWEASHPMRDNRALNGWVASIDVAKKCHLIAYAFGSGDAIGEGDEIAKANAALIVAAVNALPALLDLAEAAREYREAGHARTDISDRYGVACDEGTDEQEASVRRELIANKDRIDDALKALDARLSALASPKEKNDGR